MRTDTMRRRRLPIVLAAIAGVAFAAPAAAADKFPSAPALDAKLVRGKSTKADVLLLLGEPQGRGSTRVPTTRDLREVWYYEDNRQSGVFTMTMTQNIFLVMFRGDRYDGYLWFRNRVEATMR
jgi:hypothetical protein